MKSKLLLVMLIILAVFSSGCVKPPKVEKLVTIETNETAFLVPLEGATKKNQKQFMSIDYLNSPEVKVATKRIKIPQREKKIGRFGWNIEWIPTMKVIKVNRSPVTREWTATEDTGTTSKNEAISVESQDSIGFDVGVNLTAFIAEEDAARFLYYFAGKPLSAVVDENVRGFVTSILSREFGSRSLENCKKEKKEIINLTENATKEKFSEMGITISNIGLAEGLTYQDKEIQESINKVFTQEMAVQEAIQDKLKQDEVNKKDKAKADAQLYVAQKFAEAQEAMIAKTELEIRKMNAEAKLLSAKKWDGKLPSNIMPEGGAGYLFSLEKEEK